MIVSNVLVGRQSSLYCLLLASLCLCLGCQPSHKKPLRIATSANMQFAMQALTAAFSKQNDVECQLIVGSSGKLTAQIQQGAPYDVFASADLKYPQQVFQSGLAPSPPAIYAYGHLVVWSLQDSVCLSPDRWTDQQIRRIALAQPQTAPYGKAALQTLEYYGLKDALTPKLVYGESIGQTSQFILSQAAQVGFTARSIVMAPGQKGQGFWKAIPPQAHDPIQQGVILLKTSAETAENAEKFYAFLFSPQAQSILNTYGYTTDKEG
ncbi:MAG: molybdate ABC transporter substrate-binding protein [Bacteroidota bacterium]